MFPGCLSVSPSVRHALTGTTSNSTYLIDQLQLNLDNEGSLCWNDVYVHRFLKHYAIDGYHFVCIQHIS